MDRRTRITSIPWTRTARVNVESNPEQRMGSMRRKGKNNSKDNQGSEGRQVEPRTACRAEERQFTSGERMWIRFDWLVGKASRVLFCSQVFCHVVVLLRAFMYSVLWRFGLCYLTRSWTHCDGKCLVSQCVQGTCILRQSVSILVINIPLNLFCFGDDSHRQDARHSHHCADRRDAETAH